MSDSRCRGGLTSGERAADRGAGARRQAATGEGRRGGARLGWIVATIGTVLLGLAAGARAQELSAPAPAADAGQPPPLSLRYRFTERYGAAQDPGRPDVLFQYQVAAIKTIRRELETARGAPERHENRSRTIYTERPAKVGRMGEVLDAVRHYDRYVVDGGPQAGAAKRPVLEGLELWFHPRAGASPELTMLTPDRSIEEWEYQAVINEVFFPRLTSILPSRPVRVDDTWPISRQGAQALLPGATDGGDVDLEATLTKVEPVAGQTAQTAIIDLSGTLTFRQGEGAVRAQLWFTFEPLGASPASPAATPKAASETTSGGRGARDATVVDARGYISKVIMSLRKSLPLDKEGRLQEIQTGELQLYRRLKPAEAALLTVPDKLPPLDETNSWVVYDDPGRRFHLRHPQELAVRDIAPGDDLELVHQRPNGKTDVLLVTLVPRDKDAATNRRRNDPQAVVRDLKEQWSQNGFHVTTGQAGWLPDKDWAPLNRRVYLAESVVKPAADAAQDSGIARLYIDLYVVLFSRGDCFRIKAHTDRDDHVTFRNQVETLIRSLDLGPSTPGGAGASGQPTPAGSAGAAPSVDQPGAPPVPGLAPPIPRTDRRP